MSNTCEHGHLARKCEVCLRDGDIKELREAVKVLAEYGGSFHGLSGPFKCWDSRRAINAFDAMQANQIAAAAVREAAK